MWFNVDFNKLVILLLPTFLRKPINVAYLQAAVVPIANLHQLFLNYRTDDHYKLDHNWQKCYLQKVLNDSFDVSERKIRIESGKKTGRKYIYTNAEKQPKYLPFFIYNSSEFAGKYDFIVNMNGVHADRYDVEAVIEYYQIGGKRFNIINLVE